MVLPIENKNKRLEMEAKLIGTVSSCKECFPSNNWIGSNSPEKKICCSGLWQKQHLWEKTLNSSDVTYLQDLAKKTK